MSAREPEEKIVPFAPSPKPARSDADPLDRSGHSVVALLQEAAEVAKENCERAMSVAHRLSMQLRVAEDRIKRLEAENAVFQDRAHRAEDWLARIHKEIEHRFFDRKAPP